MRKLLFLLVIMMAVGGVLGLLMRQDSGYVLVAYNGVTVETSLWVLVVAMVIALFVLSWVKRILFIALRPSNSLAKVTGNLAQKRASRNTIRGMLELVGGNWNKAEKLLTNSAEKVPYPLINYIGAAYAASEQDEHERSKALLRSAHKSTPEAEFAIGFAQSQIQIKQEHYEGALASLLRLQKLKPKHKQVLKMLVTVYKQLKDWDALLTLTPILKKDGIFDDDNMLELERNAFLALLDKIKFRNKLGQNKKELVAEVENLWNKLDTLSQDDRMRQLYAHTLIHFGDDAKAESFIRNSLNNRWSEELVYEYGNIKQDNPKKLLTHCENWLKKEPASANLYLVCGRLSQSMMLWGKARDYYEQALSLDTQNEALAELSRLLKAMGDTKASQELMMINLSNASNQLKPLPLP
ncbi:MAG: heme biosynthesis protein HemY [Gammaproteobacteria bacterium]|jgi:HemY protein|uniref:heme biosynthesis HemY N-terminal domain-containing protein n=1 Tax=Marinomonas TaxID=28253 RepID=UPI000C2940B6|nr:heme biosynthesis HemY N-terminal domain-containing protein [Marinomonas sp. ef1]MBU1294078.1 heme biosynthesis protein HemY [Gammaproteobacteria bacterium]MBU2024973.1 heme biosynthesis protein HemY [Gammaproteobacteria bacterium]MBU2240572.1 heme biosynthesis protein HemY [Gammaproteobacteria bacterium]MBU2319974.1 heme biosynthesis protein HemY [Gammaproteobacteria bacterium]MBU2413171.1 heme biosynthesis protein HemY [Gammaproteobacteria bacterium]